MLANYFLNDKERGRAMSISLAGVAGGLILGAPFGGFTYEYFGKNAPFLMLVSLALLNVC